MFKITVILSLMFIVAVSSVWSACDSCGSECTRACGTRRFRACCFNYLRRKRGPDTFKVNALPQHEKETQSRSDWFAISNDLIARRLSNENYPYSSEIMIDNHLY